MPVTPERSFRRGCCNSTGTQAGLPPATLIMRRAFNSGATRSPLVTLLREKAAEPLFVLGSLYKHRVAQASGSACRNKSKLAILLQAGHGKG